MCNWIIKSPAFFTSFRASIPLSSQWSHYFFFQGQLLSVCVCDVAVFSIRKPARIAGPAPVQGHLHEIWSSDIITAPPTPSVFYQIITACIVVFYFFLPCDIVNMAYKPWGGEQNKMRRGEGCAIFTLWLKLHIPSVLSGIWANVTSFKTSTHV